MKKCPYCAEDILDEAVKCKHCKSNLEQKKSKEEESLPLPNEPKKEVNLKHIGVLFLIVFGIIFWYISIPLLIIWYIWKKSDFNKKQKYIGTASTVILLFIFISLHSHINRSPSLIVTEPDNNLTIQKNETTIKGQIDPPDSKLAINGVTVKSENGNFDYIAKLPNEKNIFALNVSNKNGQSSQKITINRTFTEEELTELSKEKAEKEAKKQKALDSQKEKNETEAEKKEKEISAKLNVSYNQIMDYLSNFFTMEKSTPVDGEDRYMGQNANGLATLEIIGNKENISQASLMVGIPNNNSGAIVENSAILLRFLKNTIPEWPGADDWAIDSMEKLANSSSTREEKIYGDKRIRMLIIKEMGILTVTIEPK